MTKRHAAVELLWLLVEHACAHALQLSLISNGYSVKQMLVDDREVAALKLKLAHFQTKRLPLALHY